MNRFPPKKILVAFDFSGLSATAWRQAASLARRFEAELEVVHVSDRKLSAELAPLPQPELSVGARAQLLSRIRESVGMDSKVLLASGDPALAILRLARSRRSDLIVMGTHGRTGLKRALLGSVAESVVRRSPVPVLAVRGAARDIRTVLAPVNFTDYSYYGFTYAAAAASALGARLTALHVHVDPIWNGDPERKLRLILDSLPAPLREAGRPVVENGVSDPAKGILKAGARHDLIVLVAHEKSPIKDLILGTTAERVLRGSTASVLVVPAPRGALPVRKDLPTACCAGS
jgi:nucleotide-binding universal stress UspA family protein